MMTRWLPRTLFGRMALLLVLAVLASQFLALTLLFELKLPRSFHPELVSSLSTARPPRPPLFPGLWIDIGVRLAVLILAAWVGARWLSEPIRRLATAAHELGENLDRPPIQIGGTQECVEASRVFNQMQQRIQQQVAERDRFLAAVSHDLRTPMTRLRLRLESVKDEALAASIQRDLAEMDALIGSTLDYLKGSMAPEAGVNTDIESLVSSLVDDEVEVGHTVTMEGHAQPLLAQPHALRRCLDNLVGNAVRYGSQAHVSLSDGPDAVVIAVRDQGPGLDPSEFARVMEPFYRVEGSRSRVHGGVGLGLAIASDIARRHGGTLALENAAQGGLVVTLTLPRHGTQTSGARAVDSPR